MADPSAYHLDALLGVLVLGYVVYGKLQDLRQRRAALKLPARVGKVVVRQRYTAYFVTYAWKGEERGAEFRSPPLRRSHEPGDAVEIRIDPDRTPDVPAQDGPQVGPDGAIDGGTCTLAGAPAFSFWDLLYVAGALALIVRSWLR